MRGSFQGQIPFPPTFIYALGWDWGGSDKGGENMLLLLHLEVP